MAGGTEAYFVVITAVLDQMLTPHRAADDSDPSSVVQNFLQSIQGKSSNQSQDPDRPFTTLQDLLPPSATLPFVESADEKTVDNLLSFLPPTLLLLAAEVDEVPAEDSSELATAVMESLELAQKKGILRKVLHSPQFTQSLASLTTAIRDGGLPSISEALKIPVENGGFLRRGGVPLGGGDAVETFLQGVRNHVKDPNQGNPMDTD